MKISRPMLNHALLLMIVSVLSGCASLQPGSSAPVDLLSPDHMPKWVAAAGYEKSSAWTLQDGVYWGHGGIMGYEEVFSDYLLEVDFLFDGNGEGGIQIRGDRSARRSWEVGYELDIDWARGRKEGHIHFPVNPKPYGGEARFEVGKWHRVRVKAVGESVTVHLDGEKVLEFEDSQFPRGQLCLQGEKNGVKYRNIRVTRLD